MMNTATTPKDWAVPQDLAFAGLGFDLTAAFQRAELMTLAPVIESCVQVEGDLLAVPVYGYSLQLMLGREVRAG